MDRTAVPPLELWGGVECTVNRVGNQRFDQLVRTGHATRPDDIAALADLGIGCLRVPVLWERVAPAGLETADWHYSDHCLAQCRAHDIRPIVGLLHHGSGPDGTSLLDPEFPRKFAAYAAAVARRYPWVLAWTPINEPLTTARFSALYGLWYPHRRDDGAFLAALLNQAQATVLAMAAIRTEQPLAQFVHTEDLGRTTSSPALAYQRDFENARRWFSVDLLRGAVGTGHPLRDFARPYPVVSAMIDLLCERPCAPDLLGINHYATSNRHLDDRLERYPDVPVGGNGRHRYVDVETLRVEGEVPARFDDLLAEAWERLATPLALTEVHLHCTREEQLRWLQEAWSCSQRVRRHGVDVRAVTAWALFGSVDWNCLLTRDLQCYEAGAFDVRGGKRRPTAIAHMLSALARNSHYEHPVLQSAGWWRDDNRVRWPATAARRRPLQQPGGQPVLLLGADSALGQTLAHHLRQRNLAHIASPRAQLDPAAAGAVRAALRVHRPWAVIDATDLAGVCAAESDPADCLRAAVAAAAQLARGCAATGLPLLAFSSDLVFAGDSLRPVLETDPAAPLNAYGRAKAAAEAQIFDSCATALVIRTGPTFSAAHAHGALERIVRALSAAQPVAVADDVVVSPTYLPDLAEAALDLLIDGARGLWHLANAGQASWAELAVHCAQRGHYPTQLLQPCPQAALALGPRLPAMSALRSIHGALLPSLEHALDRFLSERLPAPALATAA